MIPAAAFLSTGTVSKPRASGDDPILTDPAGAIEK